MNKRIVITGMGCLSPVGQNVDETWENIKAGISGAGKITKFDASGYKCQIAAEVKGFDGKAHFGTKDARKMDLFSQYAVFASKQALSHSGLMINNQNRDRIGAIIGSGIGGISTINSQAKILFEKGPGRISPFLIPMMLTDTAGGMVAIHLGIRGPNLAVVTACATGTNSIGEAAAVIRRGDADVMFAGGSEASVTPIAMSGMNSMTALTTRNNDPHGASRPFDAERDGFLMGEGAAVLILESLEHALARKADILAEIVGYGITNDAFHISSPAEKGEGAARCMQMSLDKAGLDAQQIDYINAHGTSTFLNDKNETEAIKTVFGDYAYSLPVSSTKSMIGHLMGASGAMEAVFLTKILQENILPPTINYQNPDPNCDLDYVPNQARPKNVEHVMSNSFGFGGHNATIVFKKYSETNA